MTNDEYLKFTRQFNELIKDVNEPQIFIYLRAQTETIIERINHRNRDYEHEIDLEFIEDISYRYEVLFDNIRSHFKTAEVLTIDTDMKTPCQVLAIVEEFITNILAKIEHYI